MREFTILVVSTFTVGWLIYAISRFKSTKAGTAWLLLLFALAVVGMASALLNLLVWMGL